MLAFACLLICLHIRYVWRFLLLCFGQLILLLRGEGTKKENRTENVKCKNVHDLAVGGATTTTTTTTNEGSVGSALILRQHLHSEKIKEGSDSDEDKINPVQERPTAGKKEEEESTNRHLQLARIATESSTDNGEGCHANGCSNNNDHDVDTSGGQQEGRAPQLAQRGERIFSPYQYYLAAAAVQSCLEDRGSRITSSSDRISVPRPAGELQRRIISLRRTTDGRSHA